MNRKIVVAASTLVAFLLAFSVEQTGNAVVEKRSGMDIYVYSIPTHAYDVIATEKIVVAMDCNELFTKPVKKAIGKCDAIIIYPEIAKYDMIRYK